MKRLMLLLLLISVVSASGVVAQETVIGYNENSLRPIHSAHILFKKRLWRRMDLKEKQNRSFFSINNEISKIIIDATKDGLLTPYWNDSLSREMTREEFLEQIKIPDAGDELSQEEIDAGFGNTSSDGDGWGDGGDNSGDGSGDDWNGSGSSSASAAPDYFLPNEVSVMEIMEDAIFDRRRSRMYWDIQTITLVIPPDKFVTGLQRNVATFKYKDLAKFFQSIPQQAVWFNPQNSAEHRNLADAFDLRLFHARIIKISNPQDLDVSSIYSSQKAGLLASEQLEYKLAEIESSFWEY